jgi:site-specific DNA recombinase
MEPGKPVSIRRCAIYTRKSSEEGLQQDFNSLHAKREACEAFIKSQASEGWRLSKTAYDDGGLSGGNMERPALKRLLADIGSGVVNLVVVYKAERLTRSLADFAKMVEVFDAHGYLSSRSLKISTRRLSFAQFEREVIGRASPGQDRRLQAQWALDGRCTAAWLRRRLRFAASSFNKQEFATVKLIFERYLKLGSVRLLKRELDRRGSFLKFVCPGRGANPAGSRSHGEHFTSCLPIPSISAKCGTG